MSKEVKIFFGRLTISELSAEVTILYSRLLNKGHLLWLRLDNILPLLTVKQKVWFAFSKQYLDSTVIAYYCKKLVGEVVFAKIQGPNESNSRVDINICL